MSIITEKPLKRSKEMYEDMMIQEEKENELIKYLETRTFEEIKRN